MELKKIEEIDNAEDYLLEELGNSIAKIQAEANKTKVLAESLLYIKNQDDEDRDQSGEN